MSEEQGSGGRARSGISRGMKRIAGEICPRCGKPVTSYYIKVVKTSRGVLEYYYAVHVESSGGRKKRSQCYLGPKEYQYTRATHEVEVREKPEFLGKTLLVPLGLVEKDRVVRYLNRLLEYVAEDSQDRGLKVRVLALLKTYVGILERKLYGGKQGEAEEA